MEGYRFHEGALPEGYGVDFEVSLFNRPEHLLLQAGGGWHSFYILREKTQKAEAVFYVHVANGEARSPLRAPFGSVEVSGNVPPLVLYNFLEFAESRLRAAGANRLVIKNPPQGYFPEHAALLETFFFNLGYRVTTAEVGTLLAVRADHAATLDTWEKRKLRQAQDAGLLFRSLPLEHLDEVYLFILACRTQKQYKLSMTLAEFRDTVLKFPARYPLFGVYHNEKLAAASAGIRVRQDVLYNFYSDHDKSFDAVSPVVFLMEGLYRYCAAENIGMLDFGTSAVDGQPNFGLLDFKRRLGGTPTQKLTFAKDIS